MKAITVIKQTNGFASLVPRNVIQIKRLSKNLNLIGHANWIWKVNIKAKTKQKKTNYLVIIIKAKTLKEKDIIWWT